MIKELLLKKSQGLPVVERPKGVESFLSCSVENEQFLINLKFVKELVELGNIVPIPEAKPNILGAINIRNEVVVVVDIRDRFKINKVSKTPFTRIVIAEIFLEKESEQIGILVDKVENIVQVPIEKVIEEQSVEKVENRNEIYEKYVDLDGKRLGVLNLRKVFFDYKV